jgi:hypothetical protein
VGFLRKFFSTMKLSKLKKKLLKSWSKGTNITQPGISGKVWFLFGSYKCLYGVSYLDVVSEFWVSFNECPYISQFSCRVSCKNLPTGQHHLVKSLMSGIQKEIPSYHGTKMFWMYIHVWF